MLCGVATGCGLRCGSAHGDVSVATWWLARAHTSQLPWQHFTPACTPSITPSSSLYHPAPPLTALFVTPPFPLPSPPPPPQWIQLRLWENHGLRTLRLTLADIANTAALAPNGTLTVPAADGAAARGAGPSSSAPSTSTPSGSSGAGSAPMVPVSVAYFRSGYGPRDYPGEKEWEGRRLVESSDAAKCPTVAYQLAGGRVAGRVGRRLGDWGSVGGATRCHFGQSAGLGGTIRHYHQKSSLEDFRPRNHCPRSKLCTVLILCLRDRCIS